MKWRDHPRQRRAFTLLEVLIAMGIFFMAIFAILGLVTQTLRAARSLRQSPADFTAAIYDLILTNRFEEGSSSGDFGKLYPNCSWMREVTAVSTNGLFQVEVAVLQNTDAGLAQSQMSTLFYRPDSPVRPGRLR